ncbi:MAG: hypothetical protein V3U24_04670 [Candidatus Neomarinimicrobiota bacterium]
MNSLDGEEVNKFRQLVDELAPRSNAYLKSIGKDPRTTDNGQLTKNKMRNITANFITR